MYILEGIKMVKKLSERNLRRLLNFNFDNVPNTRMVLEWRGNRLIYVKTIITDEMKDVIVRNVRLIANKLLNDKD